MRRLINWLRAPITSYDEGGGRSILKREMVQDLRAITHCFSARLYGLRNYRIALAKAVKADQK